mmetsp:Transcript_73433/g.203937  ORF Transcript_73433/g.203937 Transcript_73433/m.203937 type:complete len:310 (-) Transcript_73433:263-1192(-)
MTSGWHSVDPLLRRTRVRWREQDLVIASSLQQAKDPAAMLLLCLHGAYCNRATFSYLFECEALKHCSLLSVDLPGHGDTSKVPVGPPSASDFPAALEEQVEVLILLLDALDLRASPCVIVGHSMGGAIGLLLARELRDQVRGFVSFEGCIVASDTPPNGLARRWMKKAPDSASAVDLLEDIAAAGHLGRDPAGICHWKQCAECCGSTVHLFAIRMSLSLVEWCASGDLPLILDCIPSFHYVGGVTSGKITPMLMTALSGRPNCKVHELAGTGHFMLIDSPGASLQIITEAVEEVTRSMSLKRKADEALT